ncbi:MAG TPA: Arc family DNA-binding protein [Longimicrobium sp.]|nr:Arc family DNA-binding protein [Longimicrobium sp.]
MLALAAGNALPASGERRHDRLDAQREVQQLPFWFHFASWSLPMVTLTLKNVPEDLYEDLKRSAERHRRSINREAIVRLEQALRGGRPNVEDTLARVRRLRAQTPNVFVTDEALRAARDEGRP